MGILANTLASIKGYMARQEFVSHYEDAVRLDTYDTCTNNCLSAGEKLEFESLAVRAFRIALEEERAVQAANADAPEKVKETRACEQARKRSQLVIACELQRRRVEEAIRSQDTSVYQPHP